LKIIEKFIWKCGFLILLVVSEFLVMKAEHTVASYNGRDFTSKIATVSKPDLFVAIVQSMT
jgi:hypothetical protein